MDNQKLQKMDIQEAALTGELRNSKRQHVFNNWDHEADYSSKGGMEKQAFLDGKESGKHFV